ncbi:MAG: hypothetical protein ABJA82_00510 [Myxococcales bacterium]
MTLDAAIRICLEVLKMSPEAIAMAYAVPVAEVRAVTANDPKPKKRKR